MRPASTSASRILGLVQLVVLAAAGLLLLAGAAIWVRAPPARTRAPRATCASGCRSASTGGSTSRSSRRRARRLPTVTVSDAFDRGRRSARFLLAPLARRRDGARGLPLPDRPARPLRARPAPRHGRRSVRAREPHATACSAPKRSSSSRACTRSCRCPRRVATSSTATSRGRTAASIPAASSSPCATTNRATTCAACTGVRPRAAQRLMVRQNEARRRTPVLVMLDVRPNAHDRCVVRARGRSVRVGRHRVRPRRPAVRSGAEHRRHRRRSRAGGTSRASWTSSRSCEPHGPDRIVAASTRRRTGALVAVHGPDARRRQRRAQRARPRRRHARRRHHPARRFRRLGPQPPLPPDRRAVRTRSTLRRRPGTRPSSRWQRSVRLPLSASPAQA